MFCQPNYPVTYEAVTKSSFAHLGIVWCTRWTMVKLIVLVIALGRRDANEVYDDANRRV